VADGRRFSVQTVGVLAALLAAPLEWRHGYDLAKQTGLKSGTLYPILVRLADRELVEATWETEQPVGRPRRHLYRLTTTGLAEAEAASVAEAATTRRRPPCGVRHRLGLEGAR
jgi:PadR family transcriptional regulator PadR